MSDTGATRGDGSVVEVSFDGTLIKLDFGNDDDAEYEPTERLAGTGIEEVLRSNGRPPVGVNFRALLKCENGTLRFQGRIFRIKLVASRSPTTSFGGHVQSSTIPSPDFDESISQEAESPQQNNWKSYEHADDKGDTFFRYIRYSLVVCGIWKSTEDVNTVKIRYVRSGETHANHKSSANRAVVVNITGVSMEFDGNYRIKVIPNEQKFSREVLVNDILREYTDHGAFFMYAFAFRFRFTDAGNNQYGLALRLVDVMNLKKAAADSTEIPLSEIEILKGLKFLVEGRMTVDTRIQERSDGRRVQFSHGDHHDGNILVWRNPEYDGCRRFAYIDFANSDVIYERNGMTQRIYGGPIKKSASGNLLTPSGDTEAQELVSMFVRLLRSRKFESSASFLSSLGLGCTLPAAYNAVESRLTALSGESDDK